MQAVKLCTNKILQFLAGGAGALGYRCFTRLTCIILLLLLLLLIYYHYYYTRLTAFFLGQPGESRTRKVKPVWIQMIRQEIMGFWDGSGIS